MNYSPELRPTTRPTTRPITGRPPRYPQEGTWASGGYWEADARVTLSGTNVASIASREGSSVLAVSGTITQVQDPLGGVVLHDATGAATLSEIDARWAAFGGAHTTAIAFVQVTHAASPSGTVLSVRNAANTGRAPQLLYGSATALIAYRYDGTNIPGLGVTIAGGTRSTFVYVMHTDGKIYTIDAAGISAGLTDSTAAITVDRIVVGSSALLRRWGVKRPVSANPLREAQQLYSALITLR